MKRINYFISVICFSIGIIFFAVSRDYVSASIDSGYTSAATWPTILSVAMVGLAVLLFLSTLFSKDDSQNLFSLKNREFAAVLLMMLALVIYYISFRYLGCIITNAIFLPILLICFGERRWKFIVMYDIGVLVAIYVLFQIVLKSNLAPPFFM